MQASVLYLQANSHVAQSVKDKFNGEEVELLVAPSASDAFSIFEDRQISMVLADSNIPDMKLSDFIKECRKRIPDLIFGVCLDVTDTKMILNVSRMEGVRKIFLPPWDISEIVDGVFDLLERTRIDRDYEKRRNDFIEEEKNFEDTLVRLSESLLRQQYSYKKIAPFYIEAVEAFCDISSRKQETKDFIKKACRTLLLMETTESFRSVDFEKSLDKTIQKALGDYSDITISDISSCFAAGVGRSALVDIAFSTWLIVYYERLLISKGIINIDSRFVTSTKCEFTMEFSEYTSKKTSDEMPEIAGYLLSEINEIADFCDVENEEGKKRYIIRISI